MALRRRLVPVAALVVAIGASAAGAATAAATGNGGAAGKGGSTEGADKGKTVSCEIKVGGGADGKGDPTATDKIKLRGGMVPDRGSVVTKQFPGQIPGQIPGQATVKVSGQDGGNAVKDGIAAPDGITPKGPGQQPVPGPCDAEKRGVDGLADMAKKLGVTQDALLNALTATKQWVGSLGGQVTPEQFNQHVADLLGIPVAKVDAVLGSGPRIGEKTRS